MKNFLFYLFFLSILISCTPKPITINVKSAEPKLVVFTHVIPNNAMLVAVTKSFSVLDGNTEEDYSKLLVSGATVQIKFDNKTFDFIEISPGLYSSFSEAYQINMDYELIVYQGIDTVRSTTKMLPQVAFSTVLPNIEKSISDTNVFLNMEFYDLPNVSNWYLINIYRKQSGVDGVDGVNYFQNGNNFLAKSILVSDKEFNGFYQKKLPLPEINHKDSIVVTLSNINEQYFSYLGYRIGGGSVFNQLNIEPVNFPTNIINGYGFFNTHFPDVNFFDLNLF